MHRMLLCLALLGSTGCAQAVEVQLQVKSYEQIATAIKAHTGKLVVVDAWSTACEPCMKEFPGLVALHKKHAANVACISVSCDFEGIGKPEERVPEALKFLKVQGATFENYLSSDDSDTLFRKLEIPSIPAVFVYGRDGKLARKFVDKVEYAEISKYVESLLK